MAPWGNQLNGLAKPFPVVNSPKSRFHYDHRTESA